MKLWKGNKTAAEWELPAEEIARLYMESEWPDTVMRVERKVAIFMSDAAGPIASSYEQDDEYARLLDLVVDLELQRLREQKET